MSEWKFLKIGDVCDVIAGQSPKGEFYNSEGLGLPFYQGKKEFGEKNISSPQTWTTSVTKVAISGDILMSIRAPVGPVNFATQKSCIGRGLAAIRASESIDRNFLFYYLLYNQDNIKGNEGAVFASINKSQIQNISLPVPPIDEQKRIVEILDKAFEGIAKAEANTRQNLANARKLFKSHLNQIFENNKNHWNRVGVVEVCESIIDCVNKTAPQIDEVSPFKMIRTTNIRNGKIDLKNVKYVSEQVYYQWTRRQLPQKGDVLLTREAPMGEAGIIDSDEKVFLGQRIVSYRVNPEKLNNKFLLYNFLSQDIQDQIKSFASGSTVQHMRVPDTKALKLLMPSLTEQQKTVQSIDDVLQSSKRLESIYKRKLEALAELKQSILQKAFTGQLSQ